MKAAIVSISPFPEDHLFLRTLLEGWDWKIHAAHTSAEALAPLSDQEVSVIICERDLPDGGWKDILAHVATLTNAPCLMVTSRLADDFLWAEVLNLGGYDVLAKPFYPEEVTRLLDLAHLHWKCERECAFAESPICTARRTCGEPLAPAWPISSSRRACVTSSAASLRPISVSTGTARWATLPG